MTYQDWTTSVCAKVSGSCNLHAALPKDLDFFILISSLNGVIGGPAQANYGSGNAYKDALAVHRLQSGQKAVSIDLGLMVSEGIVAESADLLKSMRRIGHLMDIYQEEFLAILDYYCDPSLPILDPANAQILVGLEMPDAVTAKGIDYHHAIRRPMFRQLFQIGALSTSGQNSSHTNTLVDRALLLKRASSQDEALAIMLNCFSFKISQILGLPQADINSSRPLHTYGIDSLVAIDLKNWLARELGVKIEVFILMGNIPIYNLAKEMILKG